MADGVSCLWPSQATSSPGQFGFVDAFLSRNVVLVDTVILEAVSVLCVEFILFQSPLVNCSVQTTQEHFFSRHAHLELVM